MVRLAAALRERGAQVRLLHIGAPSDVRGAGSVGERWGAAALLRAVVAARPADVVHVQFAPSMYRFRIGVGALPLAIARTRLVTTLHEYGWWRWERLLPAPLWRRLERLRAGDRETALLVPRSGRVITTNAGHAAALRERFGPRVPVEVVPIGANVSVAPGIVRDQARRAVRADLGVSEDAAVLAFFGFVHPVKGVRYLAEAVAALRDEGREVSALVIGGFESLALPAQEAVAFEAELRGQIEAAGVGERMRITGFQEPAEVSRLLLAADVGVLPFTGGVTAKSGSLLTLLAHGLPTVVTTADESEPELVDGDRVVVVPEVRNGPALAAGVRRVLDGPALAHAVGERGRRWAEAHDWATIAERHLAAYAGAR